MKTENIILNAGAIALVVGLSTFAVASGYKTGYADSEGKFHRQAIDAKTARYNETTGIWEFKTIEDIIHDPKNIPENITEPIISGPCKLKI